MLYREIIAVCSEIHTKHISTLCGQNVQFCTVKPAGTYSNHWTVKLHISQQTRPHSSTKYNTIVALLVWRGPETHLLEVSHHLSQRQPQNWCSWFPHTYKSVHRGLSSRLEWLAVNNNTCSYWTSFEITWGSQVDAAARGCDVTHNQ